MDCWQAGDSTRKDTSWTKGHLVGQIRDESRTHRWNEEQRFRNGKNLLVGDAGGLPWDLAPRAPSRGEQEEAPVTPPTIRDEANEQSSSPGVSTIIVSGQLRQAMIPLAESASGNDTGREGCKKRQAGGASALQPGSSRNRSLTTPLLCATATGLYLLLMNGHLLCDGSCTASHVCQHHVTPLSLPLLPAALV